MLIIYKGLHVSPRCCLKDKFCIVHLKPCFKIASDGMEQLRLKFAHNILR